MARAALAAPSTAMICSHLLTSNWVNLSKIKPIALPSGKVLAVKDRPSFSSNWALTFCSSKGRDSGIHKRGTLAVPISITVLCPPDAIATSAALR